MQHATQYWIIKGSLIQKWTHARTHTIEDISKTKRIQPGCSKFFCFYFYLTVIALPFSLPFPLQLPCFLYPTRKVIRCIKDKKNYSKRPAGRCMKFYLRSSSLSESNKPQNTQHDLTVNTAQRNFLKCLFMVLPHMVTTLARHIQIHKAKISQNEQCTRCLLLFDIRVCCCRENFHYC